MHNSILSNYQRWNELCSAHIHRHKTGITIDEKWIILAWHFQACLMAFIIRNRTHSGWMADETSIGRSESDVLAVFCCCYCHFICAVVVSLIKYSKPRKCSLRKTEYSTESPLFCGWLWHWKLPVNGNNDNSNNNINSNETFAIWNFPQNDDSRVRR